MKHCRAAADCHKQSSKYDNIDAKQREAFSANFLWKKFKPDCILGCVVKSPPGKVNWKDFLRSSKYLFDSIFDVVKEVSCPC